MSLVGWLRNAMTGRSGDGTQGGGKTGAPVTIPRIMFNCDLCGVASKIRGVVYDHIKTVHPTVLDRNGHIRENREDELKPTPIAS